MGNRKRARTIDSKKLAYTLEKAGFTKIKAAEVIGLDPRNFRKYINEKNEMQLDHLELLCEEINKQSGFSVVPEDFLTDKTITANKDYVSPSGKVLVQKGEEISIPQIERNNYVKSDLVAWDEAMDRAMRMYGIGERIREMGTKELPHYIVHMQSWIGVANKYYDLLTDEQHIQLLDTIEAIADMMASKNQSEK